LAQPGIVAMLDAIYYSSTSKCVAFKMAEPVSGK
jgi:hypothetical protein